MKEKYYRVPIDTVCDEMVPYSNSWEERMMLDSNDCIVSKMNYDNFISERMEHFRKLLEKHATELYPY